MKQKKESKESKRTESVLPQSSQAPEELKEDGKGKFDPSLRQDPKTLKLGDHVIYKGQLRKLLTDVTTIKGKKAVKLTNIDKWVEVSKVTTIITIYAKEKSDGSDKETID